MTNLITFEGRLINTDLVFAGSRAFTGIYPALVWSADQLQGKSRAEVARLSAELLGRWREAGCPTDSPAWSRSVQVEH